MAHQPLTHSAEGITIMVPASISAVRVTAAAVRGIAETVLSADDADHVEVVVAEVGNNIVVHAFEGVHGEAPGREFTVTVTIGPTDLTIEFVDDGPPFDPASALPGTPEQSVARGGGGLGLFIMHRIMDECTYERVGGTNVLRLVKRRPASSTSA